MTQTYREPHCIPRTLDEVAKSSWWFEFSEDNTHSPMIEKGTWAENIEPYDQKSEKATQDLAGDIV